MSWERSYSCHHISRFNSDNNEIVYSFCLFLLCTCSSKSQWITNSQTIFPFLFRVCFQGFSSYLSTLTKIIVAHSSSCKILEAYDPHCGLLSPYSCTNASDPGNHEGIAMWRDLQVLRKLDDQNGGLFYLYSRKHFCRLCQSNRWLNEQEQRTTMK